ncbi:MAG: T9SS type A sorting domain-containing protein, partial [Pseudomonadota bacterium]
TTAGANNGSGVYGLSSATARNFVFLYDNVSGTGRPLTATYVESDGSGTSSFAAFYTSNVQGVAGAWGAIIPNNNANGLRRIEQRSISDGSLVGCIGLDTDGVWPSGANTVNPIVGATALVISNTDAALDAVSGVNYYVDADGDGFGAGAAISLCSDPGAGYSLFNTDCNDSNVAINPSASEICGNNTDDDCDTLIDEGCATGPAPANDNRASASVRVASGFPACSNIFGNLVSATNSSEALSSEPVGAGQDVWYTFVAATNGARIQATTTLNDLVLELQTSAGVLVDTENANGVGGTEVLVVNNLTPGATYFVAVRNFNTLAAGSFALCIQSLVASDPDNGTTFSNLCNSFKCDWNGAQIFSATFDDGTNQYTASSSSTSIPFSAFGGLQYNTTYQVTITTTFIQNDGTGSNPTTVVVVSPAYTITIAQHPLTSLRSIDRCPTTRPVSAFISTDRFVCGATSYDWEFVEVNPLNPAEVISLEPVIINSGSSARFIRINQLPTAEPGDRYRVRVRPVFASGPGTFTTGYEELCVAGAASMEVEEGTAIVRERSLIETISEEMAVYPNPNRGEVFTVQAAGIESEQVFVRILDMMGKEVYSTGYSVDGVLNAMIQMDRALSAGVYMIELIDGENRMVERMIVE